MYNLEGSIVVKRKTTTDFSVVVNVKKRRSPLLKAKFELLRYNPNRFPYKHLFCGRNGIDGSL